MKRPVLKDFLFIAKDQTIDSEDTRDAKHCIEKRRDNNKPDNTSQPRVEQSTEKETETETEDQLSKSFAGLKCPPTGAHRQETAKEK
jgi:hypothetical protein